MARSVANFHKSSEEALEVKDVHSLQQNGTISPAMRNSMLSSQQELQQNINHQHRSQQVFELPQRMNNPSDMSIEREIG